MKITPEVFMFSLLVAALIFAIFRHHNIKEDDSIEQHNVEPEEAVESEEELDEEEAEDVDHNNSYKTQGYLHEQRANIDACIITWNFFESIDENSPDILNWNLKRKTRATRRRCLTIICESIENIKTSTPKLLAESEQSPKQQEEEEEDDDD